MSKFFKLSAVLFGLALAFVAYVDDVKADPDTPTPKGIGGCVGRGHCGTTANGTVLSGQWREKLQ
ncbi:MAG TPA: hypothetical protein H9848_08950 [Candidatus Parabacteroides intestinigallinarum]|uniref:NVEALA protein n=1 Tax=Candidatus Parabacteroides intestinigallinarum TaxID=2838722 RepID=A0A9D1XSL9_9BACT|nr:hypothetical protein [Candidatus Parabacteroides intestinigallinarum]